jgi:hypothetical protein
MALQHNLWKWRKVETNLIELKIRMKENSARIRFFSPDHDLRKMERGENSVEKGGQKAEDC